MAERVLVDTHFRSLKEVFDKADLQRLHQIADVAWGRDKPAPAEVVEAVKQEAVAVVSATWRYGPVQEFPRLRAILEVSGRFPDADTLDYKACFERNIRVLSSAPAFGPIVAEMAFAMALAGARDLVSGDALTDLLSARKFKAAIDVFPTEPLPREHPIRHAPNTILSAHRAGGDANGYTFIGRMVVNDLEALLAGHLPQQMQATQPEIIQARGDVKI